MLHVNVARYHTTNRPASSNGPISQACAAGLGKYGYGNELYYNGKGVRELYLVKKTETLKS